MRAATPVLAPVLAPVVGWSRLLGGLPKPHGVVGRLDARVGSGVEERQFVQHRIEARPMLAQLHLARPVDWVPPGWPVQPNDLQLTLQLPRMQQDKLNKDLRAVIGKWSTACQTALAKERATVSRVRAASQRGENAYDEKAGLIEAEQRSRMQQMDQQ